MTDLCEIQAELKAPKGQFNNFGKYKYRSCEDIVEAVKPILAKRGMALILSDEIVEVGGRIYVKATATILPGLMSVSAYAREPEEKRGMDASQITGAASSYARKYALNGLFAIDDTKDADANEAQVEKKPARINRKKAQAYIKELETLIEAEDGLGLRQLNDEIKLDETLLTHVWGYFSTEQKSKAKELLHGARDAS